MTTPKKAKPAAAPAPLPRAAKAASKSILPGSNIGIDQVLSGGDSRQIPLNLLDLDEENPRFGRQAGRVGSQTAALDYIVESFGVDNLLSSLGINGFFDAEPLIVIPKKNGRFTVAEGNRRLAACLILANDPRAKNQKNRIDNWRGRTKTTWSVETVVPVRVFSEENSARELLPYLGVRHLVASQPWDSYAKAKWIADVVEKSLMTLEEIVAVIGDKNNTIERLLEGYYFVNQVAESGLYDTKESVRRGRGSNPDYPFSWVYTLLDNSGVREWLELGERKVAQRQVISAAKMSDAAATMRYLLGDKKLGRNPAITDSREIGLLAAALGDVDKRSLLRSGKSAVEIDVLSRPPMELFADYLNEAIDALSKAEALMSTEQIKKDDAFQMIDKARQLRNLISGLVERII